MIDLSFIKNKLLNYGITLENFEHQTGNLIGKTSVPSLLKAYNKELNSESAFYLVSNKVFEAANMLALGVPTKLGVDFKYTVGHEIFRDFQKAIYEEVNQRFISNSFPEFQNAASASINGINTSFGYAGGPTISDWINPLSRQIIINIDWRSFDDEANLIRDRVYLYRNFENAELPNSEKERLLSVHQDGSIYLREQDYFAKDTELKVTNKKLDLTTTNQVNNTSEINEIKQQLPQLATIDYVNQIATSFPKIEKFDIDKVYNIPSFVISNNIIYFCLKNNNIGNVPGGVSGQEWWEEISNVFVPPTPTNIIYKAGTDIKNGFVNPNKLYYLDIQLLLNQINILNSDLLFNYLNEKFSHLNLTKTETDNFYDALCQKNNEILKNLYAKKIKYYKGELILFDTRDELDKFIQKNNLVENVDFAFLADDRYLLNSTEYEIDNRIGGNDFIKRSDLPNINLANFNYVWDEGVYKTWWGSQFGNSPLGQKRIELYLNGNVTQTQFKPSFQKICGMKILKDIYETQKKYFVNVCDLSISGIIQKVENIQITFFNDVENLIENEPTMISKNNIFNKKSKKVNFWKK